MAEELLEIRPHELKFNLELRKQSSCTIQLVNKTDQYVAFKVKTTSPKKYYVRPIIAIIKPNEASDVTVTMRGQQAAPPVLQCRDKFLIQGTVVPADVFDKGSGKYIEERKMKVVLTGPVESPSLLPVRPCLVQHLRATLGLQRTLAKCKGVWFSIFEGFGKMQLHYKSPPKAFNGSKICPLRLPVAKDVSSAGVENVSPPLRVGKQYAYFQKI